MFLKSNIRIGCSGWQYTHWRADFYPAELPQRDWLAYYAQRFNTVEINNTFYRLPEASTFASWGRRAPRGFVYALKSSRQRWPVNVERFETFLKALPRARRHAMEFREPSWYRDDIFSLLERQKVSLCLHDMAGSAPDRMAIGPFVYVRFHGTQKYTGRYSNRALDEWADWLADRYRRKAAHLTHLARLQCPPWRARSGSRDGCGVSLPVRARAGSSSA